MFEEDTYFKSASGALLYLCRHTRPHISQAVMVITRNMAKLEPKAMVNLKRVLRCTEVQAGRFDLGLTYTSAEGKGFSGLGLVV